jgi:hypothetical protein
VIIIENQEKCLFSGLFQEFLENALINHFKLIVIAILSCLFEKFVILSCI